MTSPIILILGGGGAVGSAVAQKFFKNGFKVALAYRTLKPTTDETKEFLQIKADFSDSSTITSVFAEVKEKLGVPNVVVYNGPYPYFSSFIPICYGRGLIESSVFYGIYTRHTSHHPHRHPHKQHESQFHQRLCRRPISRIRLRNITIRCHKVIHLHR
jgi:hypothetical protein